MNAQGGSGMDEAVRTIEKLMMDVATQQVGVDSMNSEYQRQWDSLDGYYQLMGTPNPNPYSDLWEFWKYCKENLFSDLERKVYVAQLYDGSRSSPSSGFDLWALLHPSVVAVARSRFGTEHFADAVEAALKEVNSRVKAVVRAKTGREFDGSELMQRAFSPKNPIIQLGDLSTETGKSMQIGYLELFSGSMTGVRNPKAHANVTISKASWTKPMFRGMTPRPSRCQRQRRQAVHTLHEHALCVC
jgi:uncharacterized protein (TIGR02391 family)